MSNNAPSYKSLIGQLEAFANGHFIIKGFSFGEITDFDLAQDSRYPIMHVLHPSVSLAQGVINYDLTVIFSDLPRDFEDKTTYQMEQISDLFRLGQDLLNAITNEQNFQLFGEDAMIDGSATMTADAQETKNNLVQVTLEFTLQLPNDWSACDIPADWTIGQSGGDIPNVPVDYVISVTGLNTDNTDPQNPIVRISVDGVTITGAGTPADPLVAVGGGGAVDSVNGQTGVVVLDAGDVGADVAGAAATAETNANAYTDSAIGALTFVEGVTGNIVDSTDPQNPIVTQVQADWTQSDNTEPDFIKNKPTIPTGTVESVSGDSVDNTDPANPVVNAIPLTGTAVGSPVTGGIESGVSNIIFADDGNGNSTFLQIDPLAASLACLAAAGNSTLLENIGERIGIFAYDGIGNQGSFQINQNTGADAAAYPFTFFLGEFNTTLGTYPRIQPNGKASPTVNDDSSLGYEKDSWWIYDGRFYVCRDGASGAADWMQVGGSGVAAISGNIVDNTDPQNPVITQVQSDWNQSSNTQPDFIKNKPAILTEADVIALTLIFG